LDKSTNITDTDIATARQVRKLLLAMMALPVASLERVVQMAHESTHDQKDDPPEIFEAQGVTRQALRMFWHFRCNIEAVMPPGKDEHE